MSTQPTSHDREPGEVAIQENFWTLPIRHLDRIIDGLERRAGLFAESKQDAHAGCLREALAIVRGTRNRLLADNYDANRKRDREAAGNGS